jgi:hypothetical protein
MRQRVIGGYKPVLEIPVEIVTDRGELNTPFEVVDYSLHFLNLTVA